MLAAAVAAALGATALAVIAPFAGDAASSRPAPALPDILSLSAATFPFALIIAAAHALVLGLPLLLLGTRLGLIRWWSCLLVSFLVGLIPSALILGITLPKVILGMGALGMVAGLVFWLLWRFWVQRPPEGRARLPAQPPL